MKRQRITAFETASGIYFGRNGTAKLLRDVRHMKGKITRLANGYKVAWQSELFGWVEFSVESPDSI